MTTSTDKRQHYYSVGKRKTAIARVRLFDDGSGKVTVNGFKLQEYFSGVQIENAIAPLALIEKKQAFDVEAIVIGGGKAAQSGAVRLGISRALLLHDPDLRPTLKHEGYLRRDARIKERKKPGLKRARRAPQFSKR